MLIVDEAHAVGVYGADGSRAGRCRAASATCCVSINTAGKALGVAGAFVAGPAWAVDYLVQRARPFVFSTAPPPAVADAIEASLDDRRRANPSGGSGRCRTRCILRRRLRAAGIAVPESSSQIVPDRDRRQRARQSRWPRACRRRLRRPRHPAAERAGGHGAPSRVGQRRAVRLRRSTGSSLRSPPRFRRPGSAPRSLRNRHRHGRRQDGRVGGAAAPLSRVRRRSATGSRFRPASSKTMTRDVSKRLVGDGSRCYVEGVRLPQAVVAASGRAPERRANRRGRRCWPLPRRSRRPTGGSSKAPAVSWCRSTNPR